MDIIIAGGKKYVPQQRHINQAYHILKNNNIGAVISGDCPGGGDVVGKMLAFMIKVPVRHFPAKWKVDGVFNPAAGLDRNSEMVEVADALLAFPGGNGTADTIRKAQKKGIKVWIIS